MYLFAPDRRAPTLVFAGLTMLISSIAAAEPWSPDVTGALPWTTATGDFNNDTLRDLVFGYPDSMGGHGIVGVWVNDGDPRTSAVDNSSKSQLSYLNALSQSYVLIFGTSPVMSSSPVYNQSFSRFGTSVVTGDFDKDGRSDVAFGAPHTNINGKPLAGAVVVIYGKDLGDPLANPAVPPTPGAAVTFTQDSPGIASSAEAYDYFGEVLAAGDLNCDGIDDLAIGVPREDVNSSAPDAGYVHVLYGHAGSGLSGQGSTTLWQGGGPLSDTYEPYDHFGAALAVGVFTPSKYLEQRWCPSLAIGVPGEDIIYNGSMRGNAGRVHLIEAPSYASGGFFGGFKPISQGQEHLLDQAAAGIYSSPESGDQFGASVGRVKGSIAFLGRARSRIDELWIAAPGEACWNCVDGLIHRLDYYQGASWHSSSVRPDVLETETGVVVEKGDQFGRWLQYVPEGVDPNTAEVFVVIHGTNRYTWDQFDTWTPGRANANRFMAYEGFITAADVRNMVLIIPQFEDWNFGNDFQPSLNGGGYRALLGRDIRADLWVDRIVDRYRNVGLGDGTFNIFGHSAGAQFTIRYALQRPERVRGVIVESSGSMPKPTIDEDPNDDVDPVPASWRGGFGPLSLPASWWGPELFYEPNEALADWAAGNVPIQIVAGSKEKSSHTDKVQEWMQDVETTWGPHLMTYCEVQGVDHDSENAHRSALRALWPELAFPGAPLCL